MSLSNWLVILGGAAAIAWVNWYFLFAGRRAVAATATREQVIVVDGGYSPAILKVKAGRPIRLVFDRRDTGACSEEVVFPDFGIRRFLPTGKKTTVEVPVSGPGRYEFACGMSMHHGALVVEE
jgi:plastocyanin domain-containing protein